MNYFVQNMDYFTFISFITISLKHTLCAKAEASKES